jgi:N-acetylglutamate synthase-like GNAT family acetyltransferase
VLEAQVQAYLFALPWLRSAPPVLNSTTCVLPAQADCLYLHDLAVAPSAREHGTGRALVQAFFHVLQERGLEYACLVAVQDSGNYWRRYGFQTMELNSFLQEKLSTYGSGAEFMQLTI